MNNLNNSIIKSVDNLSYETIQNKTNKKINKIIGIDIDDVLLDSISNFIIFYNNKYNKNITYDNFTTYNIYDYIPNHEEAKKFMYDFNKSNYFKLMYPIEGSQEAIEILKKDNELISITARDEKEKHITHESINNHFAEAFSKIYHCNHFGNNGTKISKGEICDQENVDVMIDDNIYNLESCMKDTQRQLLLLDRPWNQQEIPGRIIRVKSWDEILEKIY